MIKSIFRTSILACMAAFAIVTAQGVTLGGTFVPKEKFIVYLGIGHSNMIGRSTDSAVDSITHPHCWNYKIQSNITPGWILAKPLLHAFGPDGSGGGAGNGPWMPFLKNMVARYPDYYFGVIENPESANGLACDYQPGQGEYNALITNAAKLFVGKCTFGGALMMLGLTRCERLSANIANARAFSANAANMMSHIRADLSSPNMILMVNEWENCASGDYIKTSANAQAVIAEIAKIPRLVPYSFTINNDSIKCQDDHHFKNWGYKIFTSRAIDSMHRHGWFPDARGSAIKGNFNAQKNIMELSLGLQNIKRNSLVISLPAALKNPAVNVFDSKGALVLGKGYTRDNKLCYDFPEGKNGCFIVNVTNNGQSYSKRFLMVR